MLRRLGLFLSIILLAIACKTSKPAPYVYASPILASIDLTTVIDDKIQVIYHPNNVSQDTLLFSFPAIIPGTYTLANYGQFVEEFTAFTKEGVHLKTEKINQNQWILYEAKKIDKISYWVHDTYDNEEQHSIFSPTGSSYEENQLFLLNLHGIIGYFESSQWQEHTVLIKYPSHLNGSQTEKANQENTLPYGIDKFLFNDYASLIDSPIMYQTAAPEQFTIDETAFHLSTYSPKKRHSSKTIQPSLQRILKAQKNFLGNFISPTQYSILLYLSSSANNDARGYGALEHHNATLAVLPESLSADNLEASLTDIISHEFFHILTPLHLHSEEVHNYNYQNPTMSQHLWLYEGVTEYFSILFQIDQGLLSKEEFYNRIITKINTAAQFDAIAFTKLSENILKDPYKSHYPNVYQKGALIAMCIDLIMREESKGAYGILDLLKSLISSYGSTTPFEDDALFSTIRTLSYPSVVTFLENHVDNDIAIEYNEYLNKAGLELTKKQVPTSYFIHETQPLLESDQVKNEIRFNDHVINNSFLQSLGIKNQDVLLAIDTKKYTPANFYEIFADANRWKVGTIKEFKIKRGLETLTLKATLSAPTRTVSIIKEMENSSEQQETVFKNWINE
ncbi:peptidase M61 [Aquimarina sp. 2-A2]|uniref:M61 family metallopeptidase n=1 Tax=Aquimarina sp. 2-A2 TaxID=3382644 RepID=UPI00387F127A